MQYKITGIPDHIDTRVKLPASKSISNRLLIISALSGNIIKVQNLSDSDDTQILLELLRSGTYEKNTGHAGTTMRFLTAYYATGNKEVLLTGSDRMKQRPVKELVERLNDLGAEIKYLENEGYPPLLIPGKNLQGGKLSINSGVSSQYISALLMIAPLLERGLTLELTGDTISSSYIDMTLSLMEKAGASLKREENLIQVQQGEYKPGIMAAEPDWSSASYWFMIAGIHKDARILLQDVGEFSYQGDAKITGLFDKLGVKHHFTPEGLELTGKAVETDRFEYDFRNIPDMAQSFIPYCIAKNIPFHLTGCRTLRIKETDRVEALFRELQKFGVSLSFTEDGEEISWDGKTQADWQQTPVINTYKDHRMALGLTPLFLKTGSLFIEDPGVVSKSYPLFWEDLRKAGIGIGETSEKKD